MANKHREKCWGLDLQILETNTEFWNTTIITQLIKFTAQFTRDSRLNKTVIKNKYFVLTLICLHVMWIPGYITQSQGATRTGQIQVMLIVKEDYMCLDKL